MTITRIETSNRMSQAIRSGNFVFLSGQVADGATVTEQSTKILNRIDYLLKKTGAEKSGIVSATIWLTDMATFEEFNSVWDSWVVDGAAPTRACVGAQLAFDHLLVEVSVTAVVQQ